MVGDAAWIRSWADRDRLPDLAAANDMSDEREAPFSYPGLERIFHERGRLAICTCLIAHPDGLSFTDLQAACDLTDGNLNRHVRALTDLGIVTIEKHRGAGRPMTIYRIRKR